MENFDFIIAFTTGIVTLIAIVYPDISRNLRIKIILSVLLIGSALVYFNSNHYKHWKHFDAKKLKIICKQLQPIIVDDNNFYYRYIAYAKNTYPAGIRITNFQMEFQSRVNVDGSEVLISDIPKKSLEMEIKNASVLSAKTNGLNGGQIIAISIDCSQPKRGLLLALAGATVRIEYKLFGKTHEDSVYVKPEGEWSFRMPKKEAVIFDVFQALDHRRLPDFFFTFHYSKIANDAGDRRLEIYCSDSKTRFLKIKYEHPSGVVILESGRRVHNDIDPIRILVLANNDVHVISWLGTFRQEQAATHFRKGLELVETGDYEAGAKVFKKVIDLNPKDFQARFNYGLALEKAEDYDTAIEALEGCIEVKGDYAKAHYELGNVLIKTGDEVGATSHFERAIEINPKYALAYFRLGCWQNSQGNYEEALHNLNNAIKYESNPERRDRYKKCLDELQRMKSRSDD